MRITILSPHRDDAAFSCGLTMVALLRGGSQVTVLNVFTQSDYAIDLSTVDASLSLTEGVSRARRLEDERFVADVAEIAAREAGSARLVDLDELDAPLRLAVQTERVLESPLSNEEVRAQAKRLADRIAPLVRGEDYVFAPLALGDHIDHRIAREAARLVVPADKLALYEDLPYAARISSRERKRQTNVATASNSDGAMVSYTLRLQGGAHLKSRFAMHYPSQIAPEVAEEMARYAAAGCTGDAGAEHWWAMPAIGRRLTELLRDVAEMGTGDKEQG